MRSGVAYRNLLGEWRVCGTTLPLFADTRKTEVRTVYTADVSGRHRLRNDLSWTMDGRRHCVKGWVRSDVHGVFHWRGRGRHWFVTAEWRFDLSVVDQAVGVLRYSPTLLSPGGAHVIARVELPLDEVRQRVRPEAVALGISGRSLDAMHWRFT